MTDEVIVATAMVMDAPTSLTRSISPPPVVPRKKLIVNGASAINAQDAGATNTKGASNISALAAIEAGKAKVDDHLDYFTRHLSTVVRPPSGAGVPHLSIADYETLYQRNCQNHGQHFVIHQHNHPIAGCHYDLRLQFSALSSVSFAIPYGLPGNPNSKRQGRMAIETRVHTLWNNLIESASHATGSLLIWDTGEYEVLPRKMSNTKGNETDGSEMEQDGHLGADARHENEKLFEAFQTRYIRLRLHGARLPKGYTMTLRLPSANDFAKHARPMSKKRRRGNKPPVTAAADVTDDEDAATDNVINDEIANASEEEDGDEVAIIRANNAYTGAFNTIGSIHQRHWFITLDKKNSGFMKEGSEWVPASPDTGFEAFYVRGVDVETSIVTGRTSAEVMDDEGVEGFVARKRWMPVME